MARHPKERDILGCKVKCTPLPYKTAEDNLPEVGEIVTTVFQRAIGEVDPSIVGAIKSKRPEDLTIEDLVKLLPALGPVATSVFRGLQNGVLHKLAPALFSSVIVTATNEKGELEKYELIGEGRRGEFFDEHPETYFPIFFFAGVTTYSRFFPVRDLAAKLKAATEKRAA